MCVIVTALLCKKIIMRKNKTDDVLNSIEDKT